MFERHGLLLPIPETHAPIDAKVHASFVAAQDGVQETYRMLALPGDELGKQEEAFREGRLTNPDLTAQHLDARVVQAQVERLSRWRDGLATTPMGESLRAAYEARASEAIANLGILTASAQRDMETFRAHNEFIYGPPKEQIYRAALDWFADRAAQHIDHERTVVADAAQQVQDMLRDERGDRTLLTPDAGVFESVRNDHYRPGGYYALLLAGVILPEGTVRPGVGNPIVEHVVRNNLHSSYRLRSGGSSWGVVHSESAIEHPGNYALPTPRFVGLPLGHEVGSHLLEGVNGTRGPIALASPGPRSGFDRYELGNEGRALIREEIVYPKFDLFENLVRWRDVLRRYVAIGHAWGIGSEGPRPPSETYHFVNAIDTMYAGLVKKVAPDDVPGKAHSKTWALLARVCKGGAAYGKDTVYLDGHIRNWQVAATYGPGVINEGDLGKLDITNDAHVAVAQEYGLFKPRKATSDA